MTYINTYNVTYKNAINTYKVTYKNGATPAIPCHITLYHVTYHVTSLYTMSHHSIHERMTTTDC